MGVLCHGQDAIVCHFSVNLHFRLHTRVLYLTVLSLLHHIRAPRAHIHLLHHLLRALHIGRILLQQRSRHHRRLLLRRGTHHPRISAQLIVQLQSAKNDSHFF